MVLARKLLLVLVILTALGGSVAYLATELGLTSSESSARNLGWLVFAVMTALSILLVVLIWRSLANSLQRIRSQLEQFESQDTTGMIMIDANDELARAEKAKEISEDDLHRGQKEIQKTTDEYVAEVDSALAGKEKEILEG